MILKYNGYVGFANYDKDYEVWYGAIVNIAESFTFEGNTKYKVEREFKKTVHDYIEHCDNLDRKDFERRTFIDLDMFPYTFAADFVRSIVGYNNGESKLSVADAGNIRRVLSQVLELDAEIVAVKLANACLGENYKETIRESDLS